MSRLFLITQIICHSLWQNILVLGQMLYIMQNLILEMAAGSQEELHS